jgi:malonyl-CoA/methylmalonyl-CoA synthetase
MKRFILDRGGVETAMAAKFGAAPRNHWMVRIDALEAQYGRRFAISSRGEALSFSRLARWARGIAGTVVDSGAKAGEVTAILAANGPGVAAASYGVMAAGAAEFVIDPSLGPDDLAHAVRLLGIRRAVAERALAPRLENLGVAVLELEQIGERSGGATAPSLHAPGSWGKIVLTSGTTGRPKAIVHSHRGRWIAHLMLRAHLPYLPGPRDRILLMTPFAHGAGLLTTAFLDSGASVELIAGVDGDYAAAKLARGEVNAVFAPPTVLARVLEHLPDRPVDGVRCVFCGTATLQPALYRAALARFGPVIRVTYGKSEIFNPITVLDPAEAEAYYRQAERHAGTCLGAPASGVEVVVVGDDGEPVAPGEDGEIHLRAPHMMIGQVDEGGFRALPPGAFHATGDLGYLGRCGRLFLTGRAHDVIKTGGYKIYPEEIERCLPGDTVVIGIASDHWGEVLVAVTEEDKASEAWRMAAERGVDGLARYKRPRAYLAVDRLPRNAQGKVARARLRDLVLERYRLCDGRYPRFERR